MAAGAGAGKNILMAIIISLRQMYGAASVVEWRRVVQGNQWSRKGPHDGIIIGLSHLTVCACSTMRPITLMAISGGHSPW